MKTSDAIKHWECLSIGFSKARNDSLEETASTIQSKLKASTSTYNKVQ
jgi:hypothetical protein